MRKPHEKALDKLVFACDNAACLVATFLAPVHDEKPCPGCDMAGRFLTLGGDRRGHQQPRPVV